MRALSNLITSRDVVGNILLAKKYMVKQWLLDGYLKLVHQTERVNINKLYSSNVDLLTIARICSIRETINPNCSCGTSQGNHVTFLEQANREITQIFADELKEMEDFEDIRRAQFGTRPLDIVRVIQSDHYNLKKKARHRI